METLRCFAEDRSGRCLDGTIRRRAPGHAERGAKLGLDRAALTPAPAAGGAAPHDSLTLLRDTTHPTLRSGRLESVGTPLVGAAAVASPTVSARVAHVDESPNAKTPIEGDAKLRTEPRRSAPATVCGVSRGGFETCRAFFFLSRPCFSFLVFFFLWLFDLFGKPSEVTASTSTV